MKIDDSEREELENDVAALEREALKYLNKPAT